MEANIKTILLAVQQRLAERVPELAYIDKNWDSSTTRRLRSNGPVRCSISTRFRSRRSAEADRLPTG